MVHRFQEFELDETLYELRFGGQLVATQARVFAFIVYLLRHRDRVVGKDELIRELWKAQVVSDTAISQVVMLARKALRDEGESQHIIKTVRGRGFRFIADVVEQAGLPAAKTAPRPSEPPPAPAPPRAPLIGRDAELELLGLQLSAAKAGRGGLALIEGEPGIGKTALADELSARAAALGVDVQWGRAWEEGGAPPFWPWIQVLRGFVKLEGEARVRAFMGRGAPELLALLPELASSPPSNVGETDRRLAHFRLFDAMARFFGEACRPAAQLPIDGSGARPRLIVLDDLHAVDEASVQLLRFLAPELERHALLIVATFRDFALQHNQVLSQLATDCTGARRIRLTSLRREDVADWIERKLGIESAPQLESTLHEVSGGNPLLLDELCRRFDRDAPEQLAELAALRAEPLPERIVRAVRGHLCELPEATRRALTAASALGREFTLPTLAPLLDLSEAELLDRLAPALERGVVRLSSGPDQLMFSHALVCNVVYATMAPNARLALHRQIAELLERTRSAEGQSLYEIAHHYALAAAAGCRPQALHYACLAAARANEMMAYEVAAELFDRSVQLAEAEGVDYVTQHGLMCAAGDAWYRVGQLDRAVARFERATDLSRANDDAEGLAGAVLAMASVLRGVVLYDRALQSQLNEALARLPETDGVMRAAALATRAITLRSLGSRQERDALSMAAIEMARRLNDPDTLQWTLNARHLAMWGGLHPSELLPLTTEMVELGRQTGNTEIVLDALLWRVSDLSEMGDIVASRRAQEEYIYEIERSGSPWHRYMSICCSVYDARAHGDFARARELSESARQWGMRLREPFAEASFAVRAVFERFDEGFSCDTSPCEPPSYVPSDYQPVWALACAMKGHKAEAELTLTNVLSQARSGLLIDALRRPILCVMAEVSVALEHREHAAEIYALLSPSNGLHSHLQAGVYLGPVSYYLGRLAGCLSQSEAACAHYERARTEVADSPAWRARVAYAHGRLLALQPSAAGRGQAMLLEAHDLASHLAMADLLDAVKRELDTPRPMAFESN